MFKGETEEAQKQVAAQPGTLKFFMNGTRLNTQDTLKTVRPTLGTKVWSLNFNSLFS